MPWKSNIREFVYFEWAICISWVIIQILRKFVQQLTEEEKITTNEVFTPILISCRKQLIEI